MIFRVRALAISILAILVAACSFTPSKETSSASNDPPNVKINVPAEFGRSLTVEHFKRGDDVLHIDWNRTYANAPMTRYKGGWPQQIASKDDDHPWAIDVYNGGNEKVARAYAQAKDGYEADLDEFVDYLEPPESQSRMASRRPTGVTHTAAAYFFARLERKHFSWGTAVSFLSQETQDTSMHTPENGHLKYEVWGVSKDGSHTIVAHVYAGHPKLETGGENVRGVAHKDPDFKRRYDDAWNRNNVPLLRQLDQEETAREEAEMRNHPHTRLVETCNANEFEPSLTSFDRMVDSLVVAVSR